MLTEQRLSAVSPQQLSLKADAEAWTWHSPFSSAQGNFGPDSWQGANAHASLLGSGTVPACKWWLPELPVPVFLCLPRRQLPLKDALSREPVQSPGLCTADVPCSYCHPDCKHWKLFCLEPRTWLPSYGEKKKKKKKGTKTISEF